jgi:hypothetical protein
MTGPGSRLSRAPTTLEARAPSAASPFSSILGPTRWSRSRPVSVSPARGGHLESPCQWQRVSPQRGTQRLPMQDTYPPVSALRLERINVNRPKQQLVVTETQHQRVNKSLFSASPEVFELREAHGFVRSNPLAKFSDGFSSGASDQLPRRRDQGPCRGDESRTARPAGVPACCTLHGPCAYLL